MSRKKEKRPTTNGRPLLLTRQQNRLSDWLRKRSSSSPSAARSDEPPLEWTTHIRTTSFLESLPTGWPIQIGFNSGPLVRSGPR